MASPAVAFARQNQQRFLGELKDLLRIPSVSTAPEHKADVQRAAEYVSSDLRRIGMENVELIPTKGHPLIYADWLHAPGKPTALCYAHYDVQPPDPLNEWISPPFEPAEQGISTRGIEMGGDFVEQQQRGRAPPRRDEIRVGEDQAEQQRLLLSG